MAYRKGEYSELCGECRDRAGHHCPRCASPLCEQHRSSRTRRCFTCELEYLSRETTLVRRVVVSLLVFGGLLGIFGAFATHAARNGLVHGPGAHWVIAIVPISILVIAMAFWVPGIIRGGMRRRFLAEHRREPHTAI